MPYAGQSGIDAIAGPTASACSIFLLGLSKSEIENERPDDNERCCDRERRQVWVQNER
jgi:hypothetical protein